MSKQVYGFREQADGVATIQFHRTNQPLAGAEFPVNIDYVVATGTAAGADQIASLLAAAAAGAGAAGDQHLQVCSVGICLTFDETNAASVVQRLSAGGGGGGNGLEFRYRLFQLPLRTDANGQAAFVVPFAGFSSLDGVQALLGVQACLTGTPTPIPCAGNLATLPAMPGAFNPPGNYRATAVASWYGYAFHGSADYQHD
jgi:hypothetical protein